MIVEAVKNRPVNIGRLGENEARTVRFPVDDLQSEFPGCAFMVLHRRNQDETAYPVPSTNYSVEDGYLYWTVKSGDVAQKGSGECQISAILGSKIMKTDIYMTVVGRALDDSSDPPDPWQSWAESIEERVDILEPDATSEDVGKFLKVKTVEEGKVTEYDLERLPELAIIDDTAGSGDTGKAWSANKLTSELYLKAPKESPVFNGSISMGRLGITGNNSTAFGYNVTASGNYSIAEGNSTSASGANSHASGQNTFATGANSFATGAFTNAKGYASFADGFGTTAKHKSQKVFGEYNVPDSSSAGTGERGNYVEIVGNGLRSSATSNARALDWNGNERLMGDLYVGCNANSTGGTKVAKITDIPDISGKIDEPEEEGTSGQVLTTDGNGGRSWTTVQGGGGGTSDYTDLTNKPQINGVTLAGNKSLSDLGAASANDVSAKYTKPANGIPASDLASGVIPSVPVQDVQINGTSILFDGVANVPIASTSTAGVVKINSSNGINISGQSRTLFIEGASENEIKTSSSPYKPITAPSAYYAAFYGLAKAAGDSTQSASSNNVGTYTEDAKSSIFQMLNAPVSVSGTTPSITAKAGVRYICGEVSTLSITAPASGCIDVTFTSGSTPTVLTVSSAKTGVTAIKWANGFDPTSLDADTTYEINILDGEYGVVGSWT